MLESLDNQTVGTYCLHVEWIGRQRYFDQRDFALYLSDAQARQSDAPIFRGRYNAGRPSIYVPGWIDGEFVESARIGGEIINLLVRPSERSEESPGSIETLRSAQGDSLSLAEELARRLGALIPPGGRLWFAYEAFDGAGEIMRETRAALTRRVPLLATSIGYLLYRADCWIGLRDWDIPEGGREGPRKLQGNKALNDAHARQRAAEIVPTLEHFLQQPLHTDIERRAQARAKLILPAMYAIAQIK